jgi:hypothetical protein
LIAAVGVGSGLELLPLVVLILSVASLKRFLLEEFL